MPDVAIIGGGAIGLASAWRAAQRGLEVAVVDPAPGSGATLAAAGMLAPVGEAHAGEERLLELLLNSWRRWPAFVTELEATAGVATGYARSGSLLVARDADERVALERDWSFRRDLGLDVQALSARECRRLEPRLAPATRGGVLVNGDGQVDPRSLTSALLVACERSGVDFIRERATAVVREASRARGVELSSSGTVAAACVVLAAGAWSADVRGIPGDPARCIRPVKGQILRLRSTSPEQLCERIIRGPDVYVVSRRDGRVVIGATAEERGFDTSVTAGAVHALLRDASELVPDVLELELVEVSAGLRPGSPDNAPLIGPCDLDGVVLATGHHRNGILLTPVTADAVAACVTGEPLPEVASFSPQRFVTEAVTA